MTENHVRISVDGRTHEATVREGDDGSMEIEIEGQAIPIENRTPSGGRKIVVATERRRYEVQRLDLTRVRIDDAVSTFTIEDVRSGKAGAQVPTTGLDVRPPMPGRIVRLAVEEGDTVEQGDLIGVLEAMKMQNEVTSPAHGVVRRILVGEGDTVEATQVILRLGPAEEEPPSEKKKVVA